MFFVVAGVAFGLLIALGPLSFLAGPFDAILDRIVEAATRMSATAFGELAGEDPSTWAPEAQIGNAVAAVLLPGFVCLGLILLSRASTKIRRAASALMFFAGVSAFFFLPAGTALVLFVAAVVVSSIASLASGVGVTAPLAALAAVLAARNLVILASTTAYAPIVDGAAVLSAEVGADVGVWRIVLWVLAAAPFAAAGALVLQD